MALSTMLAALATQIPLIIVCLVGIGWALTRHDRDPRAGMFVLTGLGLYLLLGVVQVFMQTPIHQALNRLLKPSPGMLSLWLNYAMVGFAFNVVRAVSLGLLVYAAFVDRPLVTPLAPPQPMR